MSGGGSNKIKDTKAQKALAQIAAKRFNLYQQYYVPLENQFMSDVFKMNSPAQMENVQSFVTALQQPKFQKQKFIQEQQMFAQGADITSGQFQDSSAQMTNAQARGMGTGTAEALSGQIDRYYQGMGNIIAMGQGQAGQAMSGLGDVGALAQKRGIAEAQSEMSSYTNTLGAAGTGLGLAYGYSRGKGGYG